MSNPQAELREAAYYIQRADAIRSIEPILARTLENAARACTAKADALKNVKSVVDYLEHELSTSA